MMGKKNFISQQLYRYYVQKHLTFSCVAFLLSINYEVMLQISACRLLSTLGNNNAAL